MSASDLCADVQLLDFSGGFAGSGTELNFNGDAVINGSRARLTNGGTFDLGTVWSKNEVEIRNFTVEFSFQVTGAGTLADGLAFAFQRSGNTDLGNGGGGMAIGGIPTAACVKFDTWKSGIPSLANTTGLYVNGSDPGDEPPSSIDLGPSGIDLGGTHVFDVVLTYDGRTLHQEVTDTTTLAVFTWDYVIDLPAAVGGNTAYVGFGGATGGATSTQEILNWTYSVDPPGHDVWLTDFPGDYQLFPRNLSTGTAEVSIEGVERNGGHAEAILRVFRNDVQVGSDQVQALSYASGDAPFSFTTSVTAELAHYDIELFLSDGVGGEISVRRAEDVVAGDVHVIQGQSNADAANYGGSASSYESPYLRTFGLNTPNASATVGATHWSLAIGDGSWNESSGVGQWGLVLGNQLIAKNSVPVAIINGADLGKPISFFQRNDPTPTDTSTNYGRLLHRMQVAGLDENVRSISYYQGETDDTAPLMAVYGDALIELRADWLDDYPTTEHFFLFQVRESTCNLVTRFDVDLRDVQRLMEDKFADVTLISVNGYDGHDGCHFTFADGYESLGLDLVEVVQRDVYGGPDPGGLDPPNPASARVIGASNDVIRIPLRNTSDTITFQAGAEADFAVEGAAVTVTGGSVVNGGEAIDLQLSGSAVSATAVIYVGHKGGAGVTPDEWVVNQNGLALLCFREPIGVDTTDPVITLIGPSTQTVECSESYVELGAMAQDDFDGTIDGLVTIDASAVNTSVPASYPVTYNVVDWSGNAATQVTRTVDVVDTTPPVITLIGDDPQVVGWSQSYTELDATAMDACDGDLSSSIVIDAGAVNTSMVGSYPVTYNVSDAAMNAAAEVTRTVNVVDLTPPVIALEGANPIKIKLNDSFVDPGTTASDGVDGDISGLVAVGGDTVNPAVEGTYTLTYDVSDAAGNAAIQVTRDVIVDGTPPVITLVGDPVVEVEGGSAYVDDGATASDTSDGDLTGSITTGGLPIDTGVVGPNLVTYDVSDQAGNPAIQVTRTVNVVDTTAPVITLTGADPLILLVGEPFSDPGATASDVVDGDLTSQIVEGGDTVVTTAPATFVRTYDVTDNSSNSTQEQRTVLVVELLPPVFQIQELGNPSNDARITFQSVLGLDYMICTSTDLATYNTLITIPGDGTELSYDHVGGFNGPARYYVVGVKKSGT